MPTFSSLALVQPFTTSNHTLIRREKVASGPPGIGYPYNLRPRIYKISYLVGGFRCASADVEEFRGSIEIHPDDPSAGGFSGRWAGGGSRADVHGNQRYGSGYPNQTTEGVNGRGFPFFFHPISYGQYPGHGSSYIYNQEYGEPDKKTRPGGPLRYIIIQPPKSLVAGPYPEIPPMTLYAIGDEQSLKEIEQQIKWKCTTSYYNGWVFADRVRISKPKKFKGPAEDPNGPIPEQAVAYYRASSAALLLVGYNNTAQATDGVHEDSPLPSVANTKFFRCINATIGESLPLVISMDAVQYRPNGASPLTAHPPVFAFLAPLVIVTWRMLFR